ncbi:MAG: succinyldiaminopimelate transaminase [Pseudomonadota bacterium]
MNIGYEQLQPYPFERLAALRERAAPATDEIINLSIGEPQHATPPFIHDALIEHLHLTAKYPATRGSEQLRETIAAWLTKRFRLASGSVCATTQVLPVNGTREALFAIAQCEIAAGSSKNLVALPNPFYQIYEGAALLAGGTPLYLNCPQELGFQPDFAAVREPDWARVALVYLCSPGNPSGTVIDEAQATLLLELADRHDFLVVADECYSELYAEESAPPPGLLEIASRTGRDDFSRCLVMHSLSKRSNAPGLRSGFVAGDAKVIERFFKYRTYHGGAMALPVQHASIAAWSDEQHVIENRRAYREKFDAVVPVVAQKLEVERPEAGFYLWPKLPLAGVEFAETLFREYGVLTLPGEFLSRAVKGHNPGHDRVRIALVAELEQCSAAAQALTELLERIG